MATVNLSWTAPTTSSDIASLEIHRFTDKTNATQAQLEAAINAAGSAGAVKSIGKTDSEYTAAAWSDTSAPTGTLTYTIVARNSAGIKLETDAHKDLTAI
jgi:hypothetical protein